MDEIETDKGGLTREVEISCKIRSETTSPNRKTAGFDINRNWKTFESDGYAAVMLYSIIMEHPTRKEHHGNIVRLLWNWMRLGTLLF